MFENFDILIRLCRSAAGVNRRDIHTLRYIELDELIQDVTLLSQGNVTSPPFILMFELLHLDPKAESQHPRTKAYSPAHQGPIA
jgi:hypothetical protein